MGQHIRVIAVLVAIGAATGALLGSGGHEYAASARLAMGADDPKTQPESTGIADAAKAIATSPSQVRAALADAGVTDRDPADFARQHVSVQSLGSSSIVELTVTDQYRGTATRIANSLAERVVRTRARVTDGDFRRVKSEIDQQLDSLSQRISDLGPVDISTTPDLLSQRDLLAQRRSTAASARVSLLSAHALEPQPAIISAADGTTRAEQSPLLPDTILGALLGLLAGLTLAAVIETFRPTVVGDQAVAREMGVPLIGSLSAEPDKPQSQEDTDRIAGRVRLAAKAGQVTNVGLVGTGDSSGLDALAGSLSVDAADAHGTPVMNGVPTGLVLVAPDTVRRSELADTAHLLRISPAPLLGVITYPSRTRPNGRHEGSLQAQGRPAS